MDDVVVIGGGIIGASAAYFLSKEGRKVKVIERDPTPLGTTAMSTGLIPGANTRLQREAGITDSPEIFANDIMKKTKGETDPNIATCLARESSKTIEWLIDEYPNQYSEPFLL